jgi:hypothetical protein
LKITRFKSTQKAKEKEYALSGFEILFKNIIFRICKIKPKYLPQKFYNKHIYFYDSRYYKSIMLTFFKKYVFGYKKPATSKEIARDMMGLF